MVVNMWSNKTDHSVQSTFAHLFESCFKSDTAYVHISFEKKGTSPMMKDYFGADIALDFIGISKKIVKAVCNIKIDGGENNDIYVIFCNENAQGSNAAKRLQF